MKNYTHFLGVDVSKKTLDLALYTASGKLLHEDNIENQEKSITSFFKKLQKRVEGLSFFSLLVCMEHTGCYTYKILQVTVKQKVDAWVENPLAIKRSLGLQRGKSDKADARRIGEYARRFSDKVRCYKPESKIITKLKKLYSIRENLVQKRASLKLSVAGRNGNQTKEEEVLSRKYFSGIIEVLSDKIADCDKEITLLYRQDVHLKKQREILQSIPGVGPQVSTLLILASEQFTRFENPKQFACYIGAAPFEHRSGTSVRGKTRTSKLGNLGIKSLLHLSARAAVRVKGYFKEYYGRKIKEGKSKMSVLNAVINKIIHCAFALIRKDEMYDCEYKHTFAT